MSKIKDFAIGQSLPPYLEDNRVREIERNRRLYNNETHELFDEANGINYPLKINLFRRVVDIYVNFLLSEGVEINYQGGDNPAIKEMMQHITSVLYLVNTDSRRYGVGVTTIDQDSGLFMVYEPDQWFTILGNSGELEGDILLDYSARTFELDREEFTEPENFKVLKMIHSDYRNMTQTIGYHELKGGNIGPLVSTARIIEIEGRQVAPLFNGYAKGQLGVSMFTDIKGVVKDMVSIKRKLSKSIQRNMNPHLAAPSGILSEKDDGKIEIDTDGMLFPLNQGDANPFYIQWDTEAVAAKFMTEEDWKSFYILTSIPPILFENQTSQSASGEALKRLMIPFLSSLYKMKQDNVSLVKMMLMMLGNYQMKNGLPQIPQEDPEILFPYEKIFIDQVNQPQPQVEENDPTPA